MTSSTPPSAPSERMSRMLLAFARCPFALTKTSAPNADAARTSTPAGRACSATPSGSRATRSARGSELADTPRLFGRPRGFDMGAAGRQRDRRRDGPLDQGRIGDADALELGVVELGE